MQMGCKVASESEERGPGLEELLGDQRCLPQYTLPGRDTGLG